MRLLCLYLAASASARWDARQPAIPQTEAARDVRAAFRAHVGGASGPGDCGAPPGAANVDNGLWVVDALDGFWVMRLDDDLDRAADWVNASLRFDVDATVDVVDATRRGVGGLLVAHAATRDPRLLALVADLGARLLPALAAAPSAPFAALASLEFGVVAPQNGRAGASLLLEFRELSRRTRRPEFAGRAEHAALAARGGEDAPDGSESGESGDGGGGALGRSVELLKTWLQTNKTSAEALAAWERAAAAAPAPPGHGACLWTGDLVGVGAAAGAAASAHVSLAKTLAAACVAVQVTGPGATAFQALRPESLEALFVLHRVTRDAKYARLAVDAFRAMEAVAPAGGVDVAAAPCVRSYSAAALKYVYLILLDNETFHGGKESAVWPLDEFIFSAAGHPLPIFSPENDAQPRDASRDASLDASRDAPLDATLEPSLDVTLDVLGTGRVTVRRGGGFDEKAVDAVEAFGIAAVLAGHLVTFEDRRRMLDALCLKLRCERSFRDTRIVDVSDLVAGGDVVWHAADEDATVAVLRFARRAVERGARLTRDVFHGVLGRFCDSFDVATLACAVGNANVTFPQPLTLAVPPRGTVTVEPWEEPAAVVERLARTLAPYAIPEAQFRDVEQWFCDRRICGRRLSQRLVIDVVVTDNLTLPLACEFWEPPALAVERFVNVELASQSEAARLDATRQALRWLCDRRDCSASPRPLALSVWAFANDSVGEVQCGELEEPADCVEDFVRMSLGFTSREPQGAATAAGALAASYADAADSGARATFTPATSDEVVESMAQMMQWFCSRRHCARAVSPRITLSDFGDFVVEPWEQPHAAVSEHLKRADALGAALEPETARRLYESVCTQRWRCKDFRADVTVTVENVGNATCRGWEEPAEVVEAFSKAVGATGINVPAKAAYKMLDLFCSQRACSRRKLGEPVAQTLVMHPGKTAGRALTTALAPLQDAFVLGHDLRCDGRGPACIVVLRDPLDRLVSALAFKKQGGEARGERVLGNGCHRWLRDRTVDGVVGDVSGLNEHCGFNDAEAAQSTHAVFRPLVWWAEAQHEPALDFLCYGTLARDFENTFAPRCPDCELRAQNPSDHAALLGHRWDAPALAAFVQRFYAADAALHDRHCGSGNASATRATGDAERSASTATDQRRGIDDRWRAPQHSDSA